METLNFGTASFGPSSDQALAYFLDQIALEAPSLEYRLSGAAGDDLEGYGGFHSLLDAESLAIMGPMQALLKAPSVFFAMRALSRALLESDYFIGVDSYSFNIRLMERLKTENPQIRNLMLVSPSVWAWRKERIASLRQWAEWVLCLYPFEPRYYEREGVQALYIGHPLSERLPLKPNLTPSEGRLNLELPEVRTIGVFSGQRAYELKYILPTFLKVAENILSRGLPVQFLFQLERPTREFLLLEENFKGKVHWRKASAEAILSASDRVLCKGGTMTLHTALCKRPMIVFYNGDALSRYLVIRKTRKHPLTHFFSLPNILYVESILGREGQLREHLEEPVVPEYFGPAQEEAIAETLVTLIEDERAARAQVNRFIEIHEHLKTLKSPFVGSVFF